MHIVSYTRSFNRFYTSTALKSAKKVLVVAEHNNEVLSPITQHTITAARKIGGELTILVAGYKCFEVAKSLSTVKRLKDVLIAENKAFIGFLPENLTPLILAIQQRYGFTHIMAGDSIFGKSLLPRIAGQLNVSPITNVMDIKKFDTVVRPIYAGKALMTLQIKDAVKIMTISQKHFEPCVLEESKNLHSKLIAITKAMNLNKMNPKRKYEMEKYQRLKQAADSLIKWQSLRAPIHEAPEGNYNKNLTIILKQNFIRITKSKLEEASIVICGGKGMKSAKNFNMLRDFARTIDAVVGATKTAVDAGFASRDMQIGQSGKIVAPNLYIAVGVYGDEEHLAGMKDSKIIVAINRNRNAPIFKVANYGLVADLFKVIPELHNRLKHQKKSYNSHSIPNPQRSLLNNTMF